LKSETIKLSLGLVAAIALDTAVQLIWKVAADRMPDTIWSWTSLAAVAREPLVLTVLILLATQFVNWVVVLNQADLSYSQPITSLSYVFVCVLSAVYLGEHISALHIAGISLVIAGVWFIVRTKRVSEPVHVLIP
jgi:drug/metabolite transporter (DMT)-like permease